MISQFIPPPTPPPTSSPHVYFYYKYRTPLKHANISGNLKFILPERVTTYGKIT